MILNVEVDLLQPLLDIEAWATLAYPRQVSMTDNLGFGIIYGKTLQKLYHAALLGFRASVGWDAVGIETALVTDADAMGVVMLGMGANHLLGTARVNGAILGDVVVVADGTEATSLVAGFQGFYCEVLIHTSGTAMYHD